MKESVSIELFRVTACKWIFTYWFYHFTRLIISVWVFFYLSFSLSLIIVVSVVAAPDWTDSFFLSLLVVSSHTERLYQMKLLAAFSNDLVESKIPSKMMEQTFKTAKIFFGNRHIDNLDSKIALFFFLLRDGTSNCVCVYVKGSCFWPLSTRADKCSIRYTSILSQTIVDIWAKF